MSCSCYSQVRDLSEVGSGHLRESPARRQQRDGARGEWVSETMSKSIQFLLQDRWVKYSPSPESALVGPAGLMIQRIKNWFKIPWFDDSIQFSNSLSHDSQKLEWIMPDLETGAQNELCCPKRSYWYNTNNLPITKNLERRKRRLKHKQIAELQNLG